jgi:hypothetical protein
VTVFKENIKKFYLLFFLLIASCKQNQQPSVQAVSSGDKCGSTSYSSEFIGEYKICRPGKNETKLKIEVKNPNIEKKYCFIPNYLDQKSKKAIYIGEPRCVFIKFPDKPVEVTLLKNRNFPNGSDDYSKFPINSVMILIDEVHSFPPPYEGPISSIEAYLKCFEYMDTLEDSGYCQAFKEMKLYTFHSFSS